MEKLKILLIDDDENHLYLLKEKLLSLGFKDLEIRNSFDEAVEYLDYNYPDLIIVDFYLDKRKTAVDFIKLLDFTKGVSVIVVSTFYDETILREVKDYNVSDFLSKSCTPFELNKSVLLSTILRKEIQKREVLNNFIFVKVGNVVKKINLIDLEMIEVDGKYLKVYADARIFAIRSTLNDIVKRLPNNFVRVHQSFVVNIDFVEHINLIDHKIQLKNVEAYFSKSYKKIILNSSYLK